MSRTWIYAAAVATMMMSALAAAAAGSFELLSSREYQSELTARSLPGAHFALRSADLGAPTISVVKPDHSAAIQPPVDIEVHFTPTAGATVNIASLKILYGFLKLDVTQRILKAPGVDVSSAGLKASGAQLPAGNHKLLIEVSDNLGRTGQQLLEFSVTK
jgi:hypothetical protein